MDAKRSMPAGKRKLLVFFPGCLLLLLLHLLVFNPAFSQSTVKDLGDVMPFGKKASDTIQGSEIVVGKIIYSLLPIVGYAPANGFVFGSAVSLARLFGIPPTRLSSGMLNFQITTKRQFIINARSKIYLTDNKWFMQGDWRMLFFTQPTYGLGVVSSTSETMHLGVNNLPQISIPQAEQLKYNHLRIYEEVVRRLWESNVYAGIGIAMDQHFSIVDERLDTVGPDVYMTNHYAYSLKNNFSSSGYGTNGLKMTLLLDKRDNIINCYHGYYASASVQYNLKIKGNSQESTQFLYDARYYLGLDKSSNRHLLAFWSWGSFLLNGNVPYLALPSIGWDTYNRSGRGYIQGRFRGLSMVYNEAEYRFPISKNGLLGGVVFVNATNASNFDESLFEKAAIGCGAGLRVMFDKSARTNLTVDFGLGSDHSGGIYLNLQEAF